MNEKNIKKWIKPVRRKLHMERAVNTAFKVFLGCSFVLLGISVMAMFIPIPFLELWMYRSALLGVSLAVFLMIFMYPSTKKTIYRADKLGLKERLITAWELRNETNAEAKLQRDELRSYIEKVNLKKLYKFRFQYRTLILAVIISVIAVGMTFIPTSSKAEAEEQAELKKKIEEQIDKLEAEKERLYEKYDIPEEQKAEIDQQLEELKKQLAEAKTQEEALKKLAIAKNEMKKLDPNEMKKDLQKLGEGLQQGNLKKMGDALKNEDLDAVKKELEELLQKMENGELTEEEIEALKEAAQSLDSEELKEALENMAEAMKNGDSQSAAQAAQNLQNAMNQLANSQSAQNMSAFSQSMQSAMNQASQQLSAGTSISQLASGSTSNGQSSGSSQGGTPVSGNSDGDSNSGGGQGEGEGEGNGEGEGQGQGQGEGNGQGQGQGQGGGKGQGQGNGGGAGEGSTNLDGGYSEESGTISHNNNTGEGKDGTYEALYQPDRLGGSSESTFVKGNKGEGGQSSFEAVEGMPIDQGDLVSYTEIAGQYKASADQSMDSLQIPAIMKDIVRDYFTSLE